jgi:acetyl esterase
MISKTMRAILHTLSYGNIEVESSRRLVDIKKLDAMNIFLKKMDIQIFNGDYEIPLRIYFPTEEAMTNGVEKGHTFPVLLRKLSNSAIWRFTRSVSSSIFSWRRMGDRKCGYL